MTVIGGLFVILGIVTLENKEIDKEIEELERQSL
jgi:hypothetical protein